MVKKKEPIYMKWWLWVIIFLITSVLINYTTYPPPTDDEINQLDNEFLLNEDVFEEPEEAIPVLASYKNGSCPDKNVDDDFSATFLIGVDLPSGEYFVMAADGEFAYILVTRNPNLEISAIIWQKHFENHTMVYLHEGEYLTIKNATLLPLEDAIVPGFENKTLYPGTYRVGTDIPPGIYTLSSVEDETGYFEIATSLYPLGAHVRERRNFNESITIALNSGDYFTFARAKIQK